MTDNQRLSLGSYLILRPPLSVVSCFVILHYAYAQCLSFYICRLDEIEILMQDLDRANQVGNYIYISLIYISVVRVCYVLLLYSPPSLYRPISSFFFLHPVHFLFFEGRVPLCSEYLIKAL